MRRTHTPLVTAIVLSVGLSCRGEPKPAARDTTATAAADELDLSCVERRNYTPSSAFVIVLLDADAAKANRIVVNAVKDQGPFSVRLQASTGAVECNAQSEEVEIRVHGEQSFLSLVVHTTKDNVAVNAKSLENGSMLNARAFRPGDPQLDLTWGGAERAYSTPRVPGPTRTPPRFVPRTP